MTPVRYYSIKKQQYFYAGINFMYTQNSNNLQVKDLDAVKTNFLNLIMTSPGTLWFEPTYGTGIYDMLFDNAILPVETLVFNKSLLACKKWLPMVTVNTSKCKLSLDSIQGKANLTYSLTENQAGPFTLGLTVYNS